MIIIHLVNSLADKTKPLCTAEEPAIKTRFISRVTCPDCLHIMVAKNEIGALEQGHKADEEKIRWELLAPDALEGTAKVLTFGAKKYDDRNWEKGIKWSRVFGALMRHLWAWFRGENNDPETGLSHLHHAACCIMFLQAYEARNMTDYDDRPRIVQDPASKQVSPQRDLVEETVNAYDSRST